MCIELDIQELLVRFRKQKEEEGINLKVVGRQGNRIFLEDPDPSDIRVEFEDWVQRLVWEELRETSIDWDVFTKELLGDDSCT